jgi:hypothetical protein
MILMSQRYALKVLMENYAKHLLCLRGRVQGEGEEGKKRRQKMQRKKRRGRRTRRRRYNE